MIELQQVNRHFRRRTAVDELTLTIEDGELFGIVGPDGAGKSTLLRMMAAVLNPSSGTISINGHDTVKDAESVKARLGYMPQRFGLYADLSVSENLSFIADVFNVQGQERTQRLETLYEFTRLASFKERRAGLLSGGMKKKLALACALIHEPEVLLLDEPTTGVDPVARRDFWDLLSGLHAKGITTVVSTPYMDEAERCNRVALIFEGRLLACDTPQNIRAMLPGKLLSLATDHTQAAVKALQPLPGILEVQTTGQKINLIVAENSPQLQESIQSTLRAANIALHNLEAVPVRMEEAFIYLVNRATKEAIA